MVVNGHIVLTVDTSGRITICLRESHLVSLLSICPPLAPYTYLIRRSINWLNGIGFNLFSICLEIQLKTTITLKCKVICGFFQCLWEGSRTYNLLTNEVYPIQNSNSFKKISKSLTIGNKRC
jgi:hypothetical protein